MSDVWSRATIKLRWVGLVALLLTLVAGVLMVPGTIAALAPGGFAVSGGEVGRVEAALRDRLDAAHVDLLLLVEAADGGPAVQPGVLVVDDGGRLAQLYARLLALDEVGGVLGPAQLPSTLGLDPSEALVMVSLVGDERTKQGALARVEAAIATVEGVEVAIGGELAANVSAQALAREDLSRAELFALPIALLILLIYFRRPIPALLPAVVGGFAITGSFPVLRGLAELSEVSLFALNIVVFLGLGLAVDYSLFIVQRQREELAVGNSVEVALARTLQTAGKTVLFSGIAVIVSLLALAWVPISLLRSVALGGALVVVLANVGALVILPALLALLGHRIAGSGLLGGGPTDPRLLRAHGSAGRPGSRSAWARVAGVVMGKPGLVAGLVGVALLLTATPVLRMQTATADARIFPPDTGVHQVHAAASDPERFAVDPSATHSLWIETRAGAAMLSGDSLAALAEFADTIAALPGVVAVEGLSSLPLAQPAGPGQPSFAELLAAGELASLPAALRAQVDALVDGDATVLRVSSLLSPSSPAARAQLDAIEAAVPPGLELAIAGQAARARELDAALADRLPWAALTVALASFVVLVLAFGAPVVAIKAVIMNALSLTASFGALVWVFQDGRFEGLLHYKSIGTIEPTVPVMMFALVFGLSMDYELFLLSRIREARLGLPDGTSLADADRRSVEQGLTQTGPIITTAAAILIVVVLGLAAGTLVFMKQLGIGMALAIVLDATLIRLLLVPSTMALLGRWNWWSPAWLAAARAKLRLELREGEAVYVPPRSA
jgi:trehalose monomycolate/heme transporter